LVQFFLIIDSSLGLSSFFIKAVNELNLEPVYKLYKLTIFEHLRNDLERVRCADELICNNSKILFIQIRKLSFSLSSFTCKVLVMGEEEFTSGLNVCSLFKGYFIIIYYKFSNIQNQQPDSGPAPSPAIYNAVSSRS